MIHADLCSGAGTTLASTALVRIYRPAGRRAVGCRRSSGQTWQLERTGERLVAIRVVRRWAAVTLRSGDLLQVASIDLRHGTRRFVQVPAGDGVGAKVTDLIVKSSGAVAWIACARAADCTHGHADQVRSYDAIGLSRLAYAPGRIQAGSLRRAGNTISWRQDGTRRAAKLR